MEKKRVLDEVGIDVNIFMTSFDKCSKLLLEHKNRLEKEGWSSLHFKMRYYHDSAELVVMGMRLETYDEFKRRRVKEEVKNAAIKRREELDRKKYEKLKTKFEK
jgi:hypothetical protein